ncbi:MAG: hypothetical protein ACREDE_11605, partial [Thermoplasmata archaeon]
MILVGLLLAPALGAATSSSPLSADSAAYNSGAVLVRFPAASPSVELVQDSNPSVNSILNVTHVLELAPVNGSHPLVELAADPATSSPFNTSSSSGVGRFSLGLNGTIGVRYGGFALWATPAPPSLEVNPPKGQADLTLSYQLLSPSVGVQGVSLNWSIQNWPWFSSRDLLGLELAFAVPNGTGFSSCLGAVSTPCPGTALAPG